MSDEGPLKAYREAVVLLIDGFKELNYVKELRKKNINLDLVLSPTKEAAIKRSEYEKYIKTGNVEIQNAQQIEEKIENFVDEYIEDLVSRKIDEIIKKAKFQKE